ncbi:PREDICTED: protein stum-like [Dinoponera quadriceps]|uniref:Protein stum-like n=1 Tax=Dinoponera quadriceps TaxID=609295 RepID=A0A6P3YIC3_DINQU|nr:PREDICTED: protein stum-like [Dinoponera quadriceps]XP_014489537.1 PREDICTED: protein stum-like [Dinoponera quadriceps]
MRRTDHDGHAVRQGPPPFRVLASPDVAYLPPPSSTPPPPPRAPEPYKIAPSTTSFGRAHRRSSFVILAESRPATPESADASAGLPTGRVSPFRGRGFKGPPPRSRSRPQSPEVATDGRRRGRIERRASVSQQNSPRRSLIPQPTYRQRSSSLTKANDRSPSPRIGRRVDSRTRLNVSSSRDRLNATNEPRSTRLNDSRTRLNKSDSKSRANLGGEPARARFVSGSTGNLSNNPAATRNRQTTRGSTRLSPIQGTPTKPEKASGQSLMRGDRARDSSSRPVAKTTPRASPQKSNVERTRRDNQNRNTSKDRVTSPSKIPLKTSSRNGAPSNTAGRFITMPEQGSEATRKTDRAVKEGKNKDETTENGQSPEAKPKEVNGDSPGLQTDEVDLIGLLKQSSPHTIATSSERLVNTTTSTAVKPLHIDANALLVERTDGSSSQPRDPSSASPASSKDASPASTQQNAAPARSTMENQPAVKASQPSNSASEKRESPVGAESSHYSKSGQTARNASRANGEAHQRPSNQSSGNQRSAKNGARGPKQAADAGKLLAEEAASSPAEVKSGSAGRELPADRMPTVMENARPGEGMKSTPATNNAATTRNSATTVNNTTAASSRMTNSGAKAGNHDNQHANSAAGGAVNASVNSGARPRNENRGSDASLKSSTGVSTDSIESVRSTDTGVSVNTVRGVSSPREKTGVHVVKRQEIETLSGNVVCVEQNGEPAVLTSSNEKQRDNERLLTRWGRSLSRYCKCCPGMRCLACRRDPKGLLWTRNQGRMTVISDDSTPPVAAVPFNVSLSPPPPPPPPPATNASSCWSKLKTRCRCTRLREFKCCARKARIAPAESTACCPPERRFGAICRRVFGCCSCKRADKQQRTRNVRAKHSLTSVAPPPLSEEPKAKLPDVLVEHNSVMRGAIPCLPVPLAWFCLVWNVLLPGSGTIWSGLFNMCTGQPRFSPVAGLKSRLGAFIVNLVVGVGQLFTVLFCLVGWGWSIWWGVTMVRLARKYKRFKASEAVSNDLEARGGEPAALPPGVPSQALRGIERAR